MAAASSRGRSGHSRTSTKPVTADPGLPPRGAPQSSSAGIRSADLFDEGLPRARTQGGKSSREGNTAKDEHQEGGKKHRQTDVITAGSRGGGQEEVKTVKRKAQPDTGIRHRTAMGEYIPPSGKNPLSSLAIPTPSPQTYSPHLLPSGRCISILGKHPDSQSQVTGPGPQKYNTDPIKVVFEEAPKWSMQGKERKQVKVVDDACPGPGKYDVKTSVGKGSPSFSMSGWQPVFEPIIPSPQTYYPTAAIGRTGAPQYSFGIKPLDGHEISPGPQDYTIPRVPPHARSSPHCTFRPPSKELPVREDEPSPAPNAYYPRASWNQKSATLKGCYKESKVTMKTPGPANYLMPNDLFTGPQFSISAKNAGDLSVANKPGPADYKPSFDLTRDQGPAVTLKGRHESRDGLSAKSIPGPGAYTPRDRQLRGNDGPKVTIKGRRKELAECTPGPADYQTTPVVTPAQLARYDAKEKDKLRVIVEKPKPNPTPGPGSYTLTPLDKTKAAGPKYSLRKRLDHLLKYSTTMKSPGPNAYQAVDVLTPRATTFKSRMSPYVTVFPSTRIDTLQVKV